MAHGLPLNVGFGYTYIFSFQRALPEGLFPSSGICIQHGQLFQFGNTYQNTCAQDMIYS